MKKDKKEEQSAHINIDGEDYSMINITRTNGELIASISAKSVIEAKGYKVKFEKDSNNVRFTELLD